MVSRILLTLLITSLSLTAETRVWRSADGTKSIEAQFMKRDAASVTIRRPDQRVVTIPLEKIHNDDRTWLDARHPLPALPLPPAAERVLDLFVFGETRPQVLEKLKASELVKITLPETMLGRTGLNGVFQTRQKLGGLDASLYFGWTQDGGLKEVTLQTSPLSGDETEARLASCWKEFIDVLTSHLGHPVHASGKLDLASIPDASMIPTHIWKPEHRGTFILGVARDSEGYQIAVRRTSEDINPVFIPAPQPANANP